MEADGVEVWPCECVSLEIFYRLLWIPEWE